MPEQDAGTRGAGTTLDRIERLLRGLDDRLRRIEADAAGLGATVFRLPTARALLTGDTALAAATFALAFVAVRFGTLC